MLNQLHQSIIPTANLQDFAMVELQANAGENLPQCSSIETKIANSEARLRDAILARYDELIAGGYTVKQLSEKAGLAMPAFWNALQRIRDEKDLRLSSIFGLIHAFDMQVKLAYNRVPAKTKKVVRYKESI